MDGPMKRLIQPAGMACLGLFLLYILAPVMPVSDSKWTIFETVSLLRRGDMDLDEYSQWLILLKYHGTVSAGGLTYDFFPVGMTVMSAIPVFLLSRIFSYGFLESHPFQSELFIASAMMCAASIFQYRAARRHLSVPASLAIAAIFALGTQACSTGSRALWQQTGIILLASIFLYYVHDLASARTGKLIALGLLLGMAYVIRPAASVWIIVACVYALRVCSWRQAAFLFGAGGFVGILFAAYNLHIYESILPPYYSPNRVFHNTQFLEALAGNLVSPARGIFIWSPVFLFSMYGAYCLMRGEQLQFGIYAFAFILLHWILIASFPDWWGGHSIGSRLMSETAPFLTYLLIPFVRRLQEQPRAAAAFWLAAMVSMVFHTRSIYVPEVNAWNQQPEINSNPEQIWNWKDPQFLAGESTLGVFLRIRR